MNFRLKSLSSPSLIALAVALALPLFARPAHAEGQVPVMVLSAEGAALGTSIEPVVTALGASNVLVGPALAAAIRERYGRPAPVNNPLSAVSTRIDEQRRAYNSATAANDAALQASALDALDRIAGEIEQQADVLSAFSDARDQLARALLFVAETTLQTSPARADDALRRLAMMDPQRTLTARAASAAVRAAFTTQVQALATGALVVQSTPAGCEVSRDGRSVGLSPAQLTGLAPGSHHRVSIRCGGRQSLLHPAQVGQGVTSTLTIDSQLDSALSLGDLPALQYSSLDGTRARWADDLARIGTALGVVRIVGVLAGRNEAVIVDVVRSAIVAESPLSDIARLRTYALGSAISQTQSTGTPSTATTPANTLPAPEHTTTTASNQVRGPDVRVSEVAVVAPPPERREVRTTVRGGVPAMAIVLGVVGAGGIVAGVFLDGMSQGARNRAEQWGSNPADRVMGRQAEETSAQTFQIASLVSVGAGAGLVLTGVLYGILGRSSHVESTWVTARLTPRVHVGPDAVTLGLGGSL
ncbi:MAG: PEGA domain-containing protein [Deltaproteobacteria bacterium]|nr:PEGA domain-containing protein [Deltaproteobacteria bacterium]